MFELPDSGEHPEQPYGFDDVPLYSLVKLRGDRGYVLDKGDHIASTKGRHLLISFEDETARKRNAQLHERLVNKYLHEKRNLFVDFTGEMIAATDVDTEEIR